jgi:hypothetical protein
MSSITNRSPARTVPMLLLLAGCCVALSTMVGCGRQGPEVVPVKGTITFGGGPWPKPGVLYFTAESPAAGLPVRPATGKFDTEGNVTVTTFTEGDGLIPGKYKIGVECWEVAPTMGQQTPPKSYVPIRYDSPTSSGLTLMVETGQRSVRLDLDVARDQK